MVKQRSRITSLILTFAMLVSMIPANAFSFSDGSTVILPISDDAVLQQAGFFGLGDTVLYTNTSEESIALGWITLPDLGLSSSDRYEDARLVIYDGSEVIGLTEEFEVYADKSEAYETLYFLDYLNPGDYDIYITYNSGNETVETQYCITAVESPVIAYGNMQLYKAKELTSELSLTIAGYNGGYSNYIVELLDENGDPVDSTIEFKDVDYYSQRANLKWDITSNVDLDPSIEYFIQITNTAGELYSRAAGISSYPETLENRLLIVDATYSNLGSDELRIVAAGINTENEYNVNVRDRMNGTYFDGIVTPEIEGPKAYFDVQLTFNGEPIRLCDITDNELVITIENQNDIWDDCDYYLDLPYADYETYHHLLVEKTASGIHFELLVENQNIWLADIDKSNPGLSVDCQMKDDSWHYVDVPEINNISYSESANSGYRIQLDWDMDIGVNIADIKYIDISHDLSSSIATAYVEGRFNTSNDLICKNWGTSGDSGRYYPSWFFDELYVFVTLENEGQDVSASLWDMTDNSEVSTSNTPHAITETSNGTVYTFRFDEPASFDYSKFYGIKVSSNNQELTVVDDLEFDNNISVSYWSAYADVGSTNVRLKILPGQLSRQEIVDNFPVLTHKVTREILDVSNIDIVIDIDLEDGNYYQPVDYYLDIELNSPIKLGIYSVPEDYPHNFSIYGESDKNSEGHEITADLIDNYIIVEAGNYSQNNNYSGIIYKNNQIVKEFTFEVIDNNSLIGLIDELDTLGFGEFLIEIYENSELLTIKSFKLSEMMQVEKITLREAIYNSEYDYYYPNNTLSGIVTTGSELGYGVFIDASYGTYGYIRYTDSNNIESLEYKTYTSYSDNLLLWSDDSLNKTISYQFKNRDGQESPVFTYNLSLINTAPEIISVDVLDESGKSIESAMLGDTITVVLESTSKMATAEVSWLDSEGDIVDSDNTLVFNNETERFEYEKKLYDIDQGLRDIRTAKFTLYNSKHKEIDSESIAFRVYDEHLDDNVPPSNPKNLVSTLGDYDRYLSAVSLEWDESTDDVEMAGYQIYRNGTLVDTIDWVEKYVDTGLEMDTEYTYEVYAIDANGNVSEGAATGTFKTAKVWINRYDEAEPTYIKGEGRLFDTDLAIGSEYLSPSEDIAKYFDIRRSGETDWESHDTSDYSYSFDITSLELGDYEYRYRYEINTDYSKVSDETEVLTFSVLPDTIPPEVYNFYISSVDSSTIDKGTDGMPLSGGKEPDLDLNIIISDNADLDKAELYYSLNEPGNWVLFDTVEAEEKGATIGDSAGFGADTSNIDNLNLVEGIIYFKIKVYDESGNITEVGKDTRAGESDEYLSIEIDNKPPAKPEGLSVYNDDRYLYAMWTYGSIPNYNKYKDWNGFNVYRSTSPDSGFELVASIDSIGYRDDIQDDEILANTFYYYKVSAYDYLGNESEFTDVKSGMVIIDESNPEIAKVQHKDGSVFDSPSVDLQVIGEDTLGIKKAKFEIKKATDQEYTELGIVTMPDSVGMETSYIFEYTLDLTSYDSGEYNIRYTVYDIVENASEPVETTVTIEKYIPAFAVSNLNAESTGHKEVTVTWDTTGVDYHSYRLYRSIDNGQTYTKVSEGNDLFTNYKDTLEFGGESLDVKYKVETFDSAGASAYCNAVSVTAIAADAEPPVALINSSCKLGMVGEPVVFNGKPSTDNDGIASYEWRITGENLDVELSGAKVIYTFAEEGIYVAKLTVTDNYGNTHWAQTAVEIVNVVEEDDHNTFVTFTIKDQDTGEIIENANIDIANATEQYSVSTDSNGVASMVIPNGHYDIAVIASGYRVSIFGIDFNGGIVERTLTASTGEVLLGQLTSEEMTKEEMIEAGIDVDDPDNQHVWKWEAELTFTAGLEEFEVSFTWFTNSKGEGFGGGLGYPGGGGSGGSGGGGGFPGLPHVNIVPSEKFLLVIYGEARWLKEMYDVELILFNNSAVGPLVDIEAELDLPDGLSLAAMVDGEQSAKIEIDNIDPKSYTSHHWYVRGDKEGEYDLRAEVDYTEMPNNVRGKIVFETAEPLRVYAGSAFNLHITAPDMTARGEQYPVKFKFTNVSDKTMYDVSFGIQGIKLYKVVSLGGKAENWPITGQEFGDTLTREIDVMDPGDFFEIEISSTIWFNSILEVGVAAAKSYLEVKGAGFLGDYINVKYYLTDIGITTLDGSTTEVPTTWEIVKAPRRNIAIMMYDTAKQLYGGDDGDDGGEQLGDFLINQMTSEMPVWGVEGAKIVLGLQQGMTDTDVKITLSDGGKDGAGLSNESVHITTGDNLNLVYENLNNATIKFGEDDRDGILVIEGLTDGTSTLNLNFTKDSANVNVNIPITINGERVMTDINVGKDSDGKFKINTDMISQVTKELQKKEGDTFRDNPYLWFASRVDLNLVASEDGTENILNFKDGDMKGLLTQTVVEYINVKAEDAGIEIPRVTMEDILDKTDVDDEINISINKLSDEIAAELGIDRPTYDLLIERVIDDIPEEYKHFGAGEIKVEIPYVLQDGETVDDIEVRRLLEEGFDVLDFYYDEEAQMVVFYTNQFSLYQIALKDDTGDSGSGDSGSGSGDSGDSGDSGSGDTGDSGSGDSGSGDSGDSDSGNTGGNQGGNSGNSGNSGGSSSGGSGSSGSSSGTTTETEKNPDGSVTTTETNKTTGTVTETTKNPDGSRVVVETSKNGDTKTTETRPDGTKVVTETEDGKTTSNVTIPSKKDEVIVREVEIPVDTGRVNTGIADVTIKYNDGTTEELRLLVSGDTLKLTLDKSAKIEVSEDIDQIDSRFFDVSTDAYYSDAVAWAMALGITNGIGNGNFGPDLACSREQVIVFLWRAAGSPEPLTKINRFADVDADDYFYKAVLWAAENGITVGVDENNFGVKSPCTRGQIMTFLFRAFGKELEVENPFNDVNPEMYYYDPILWGSVYGITSGTTKYTFSPDDICTRAQIVTFLFRNAH